MLYAFFWVILILVHSTHIYLPMKMEQTEFSETSAYKLQTPGNYPEESIQPNSCSSKFFECAEKDKIFIYNCNY